MTVDPVSGNAYVVDQINRRINEFTAWGEFVRSWGWGVADGSPELQTCTTSCLAGITGAGPGQFFKGMGVAGDASGDVYVLDSGNFRVQKFDVSGPEVQFELMFGGDVITNGAAGTGVVTNGSASVTSVLTTSKLFKVGQTIEGTGIEPGTTIAAVGSGMITLSQAAGPSATGATTNLTAPEGPNNVPSNETQSVALGANTTGGTFNLTYTTPNPSPSTATATAIPFNASAAELEAKLEGLANIGAGNVAVSGAAGGPWSVEFKGTRFADTDVNRMSANAAGLTVSSGTGKVTIKSAKAGEVCSVSAECQAGSEGIGPGQFGALAEGSYIAASPGAPQTIYVGDQERIQEFDTGGNYLGDLPDPDGVLAGNTVQSLAVDPDSGRLFVSFASASPVVNFAEDNVFKLNPASGENECTLAVPRASAVATDASGGVHVVSAKHRITGGEPMAVVEFDATTCVEVERFDATAEGFIYSSGIATSSPDTCGLKGVDLFVSSMDNEFSSDSFVRLYGPPPDPDVCPPPEVPPEISDQYAVSVGSEGATVQAKINPLFWPDTRYYVEYGTGECSKGGCGATQPLPPGSLLTEEIKNAEITTAGVFLAGLEPGTTYNYRFVAESSGGGPVKGVGATEAEPEGEEATLTTFPLPQAPPPCPNDAFRSGLSATLPDCRAYELVSPLDKKNGDIGTGDSSFDLASADGNEATYSAITSFGDPQGAPLLSQYLSGRNPATGWSTRSISPPRTSIPFYAPGSSVNITQFKGFTEDLCKGWFIQDTNLALVPGAPPDVANSYQVDLCGVEGYDLITTVAPPGFGGGTETIESNYVPQVQGFSADGSRTLLRADAVLTPDACKTNSGKIVEGKGIYQVYLHNLEEGELRLVSVMPNGNPACDHSSVGTAQGGHGEAREDNVFQAVSADASRIFWSMSEADNNKTPALEGGSGDQAGKLFVRLNPTGPQSASGKCSDAEPGEACTIQITKTKEKDARFWGADPAGTTAIYTAVEGGLQGLYEYDVDAEVGTQLLKEGVKGVMGVSADASRVYFVSSQVLSGEPNSEDDEALLGANNLYLYEKGVGFTFIGRLSSLDMHNAPSVFEKLSPLATLPDKRTSRVSADGLHLAFNSAASLTGYDNTDLATGEPAIEVYLYDAVPGGVMGELNCISCNPTGVRPRARNLHIAVEPRWAAAKLPGWEYQLRPSRALAAGGDRLFFESFEALVPRDTNGKQDVYEWERATSAQECLEGHGAELHVPDAGGCISLISSGKSAIDSEFLDASASGADAFFTTAASLLPQDFGLVDVYDAREGGGFPPPPPPNPPCEGEACQPAVTPPLPPTPSSSTFEGAGNVSPPKRRRCGKGKRRVVRGGKARCVKKRQGQRKGKRDAARRGSG